MKRSSSAFKKMEGGGLSITHKFPQFEPNLDMSQRLHPRQMTLSPGGGSEFRAK